MFSDDFYSVNLLYLIYKHCLVKILKYSVSCEIELIYMYIPEFYLTQYTTVYLNNTQLTFNNDLEKVVLCSEAPKI